MRRSIWMLSIAASALCAETISVQKVVVEDTALAPTTQKEMGWERIRSTKQKDLAQMLQAVLPEINLVRASGIGSDLQLRGLKKDNINVLIDGNKIYGGCPNRMDPPAMHISSDRIAAIKVKEGPFDVADFGSLGGTIDVVTKDPLPGKNASVKLSLGSFDYQKGTLSVEGGGERFRMLGGISYEESDQYKDGEGKTMVEQIARKAPPPNRYKPAYADAKAYKRVQFWTKALYLPQEGQRVTLDYMRDNAWNVLYPAFMMDAQKDSTDMVTFAYRIDGLGRYSDRLLLKSYYSRVTHHMGTNFRNASAVAAMNKTHAVEAKILGAKLENTKNVGTTKVVVGLDTSRRNWNGLCHDNPTWAVKQVRIPDVDTKNVGLYAKAIRQSGAWHLDLGARYDMTDVDAHALDDPKVPMPAKRYYRGKESRTYDDLSANLMTRYRYSEDTSFTLGIGRSIRVPDAQELYFISYDGIHHRWMRRGDPDLQESKNDEIDLGMETLLFDASLKANLFYSRLEDYIYAYKEGSDLTFTNIDAHIYGGDLSLMAMLSDAFTLDASVAYQRGRKNAPLPGQSDLDLAEMPPLKGRLALTYDAGGAYALIETIAAAGQTIDSDNGERPVAGYAILNLKGGYDVDTHLKLDFGIENILDKTYALNNSYVGRGLVANQSSDVLVLHEPGRNLYLNAVYSF